MYNNLVARNFEKLVPSNQLIHGIHAILLNISSCYQMKIHVLVFLNTRENNAHLAFYHLILYKCKLKHAYKPNVQTRNAYKP